MAATIPAMVCDETESKISKQSDFGNHAALCSTKFFFIWSCTVAKGKKAIEIGLEHGAQAQEGCTQAGRLVKVKVIGNNHFMKHVKRKVTLMVLLLYPTTKHKLLGLSVLFSQACLFIKVTAYLWTILTPREHRTKDSACLFIKVTDYLRTILTLWEHRKPQKSRAKINFLTGYTLSTRN